MSSREYKVGDKVRFRNDDSVSTYWRGKKGVIIETERTGLGIRYHFQRIPDGFVSGTRDTSLFSLDGTLLFKMEIGE